MTEANGICSLCSNIVGPDLVGSTCVGCLDRFEPDHEPNLTAHDDAGEEFLASEKAALKNIIEESVDKNKSSHIPWDQELKDEENKPIEQNLNYQELDKKSREFMQSIKKRYERRSQ